MSLSRMIPCLSMIVLLAVTGCASKADLDATQALLEECRADKSLAQDTATDCQARYDREVRRWQDTDALLAEVLPRAMQDFDEERERIVELIPEATREEVEGYLDQLADGLARGFQVLREENEAVLLQLEIAQTKLDVLEAQTDSLGEKTDSLNESTASITASLDEALQKQQRAALEMRRSVAGVVESIHRFDLDYINDRESPQRLHLNRNQRETIKAFHDEVVGRLSALGSG